VGLLLATLLIGLRYDVVFKIKKEVEEPHQSLSHACYTRFCLFYESSCLLMLLEVTLLSRLHERDSRHGW
jgi:hypothetical protein